MRSRQPQRTDISDGGVLYLESRSARSVSPMRDDSGDDTVRVAVSRAPAAFVVGAAVGIVSSIIAVIVGRRLADQLGCGDGTGEAGSSSYGWIKLFVGTSFLIPGVVAAIVSRKFMGRTLLRTLVWVTCVGAVPVLVAWSARLDRLDGCVS